MEFECAIVFLSNLSGKIRKETAKQTDSRAEMMHQLIGGIRLIKMYTWELPFFSTINQIRRMEVKCFKRGAYLRGLCTSIQLTAGELLTLVTVLTMFLMGVPLRGHQVFLIATISTLMRHAMLYRIPIALANLKEMTATLERIEGFLLLEETSNIQMGMAKHLSVDSGPSKNPGKVPSVNIVDASASWIATKTTLDGITVSLKGPQLVIIVGPVGAGKSSFLQMILSELELKDGKCQVDGKISFASQDPWIFPATFRQNVIFSREFDSERYNEVVEACALRHDLDQFELGDVTRVGEKGVMLSGGQKSRVNLARALYEDADIYLLDDPLSSVDVQVSRQIFENSIQRLLKDKLVILVTHQLQYLPQADHVVLLNEGKIQAQGKYEKLVQDGVDFENLVGQTHQQFDNQRQGNGDSSKKVSWSMTEPDCAKTSSQELAHKEKEAQGSMSRQTYIKYFTAGNSVFGLIRLISGYILAQLLTASSLYWISNWTNRVDSSFESCHQSDPLKCQVDIDTELYLTIYTALVVGGFVMTVGRCIYSSYYCLRISTNIHNRMLARIIRVPTKFFDLNPSGRILNRFVKDVGSMDESLMKSLTDVVSQVLQSSSYIILIIFSNYPLVLPSTAFVAFLMWARKIFISGSHQVRRIEATVRSRIVTHLMASAQGIETIRASHAETVLIHQYDQHQDVHSAAWCVFMSSQRWFITMTRLSSAIYMGVVLYACVILEPWIGSEHVGLLVSSAVSVSFSFFLLMWQGQQMENEFTSVERTLEYCELEEEPPVESPMDQKIPKDWSHLGRIQFCGVSLSYRPGLPQVLKNVSFTVQPNVKVGVVGRTGAGKSSLVAALFRVCDPDRGDILIDGISILSLGLHQLRSKISIIPQHPVLFSHTIRYNLDPTHQFQDDQLWTVIHQVDLAHVIPNLELKVEDGGVNFSVGQRQLVCLARVLLQSNRILVLDEATANVDPRTDGLIQKIIRSKSDCTMIIIAHRLSSVIDCDRLLVLEDGSVLEFDTPTKLLSNPQSHLNRLIHGDTIQLDQSL